MLSWVRVSSRHDTGKGEGYRHRRMRVGRKFGRVQTCRRHFDEQGRRAAIDQQKRPWNRFRRSSAAHFSRPEQMVERTLPGHLSMRCDA